MRQLVPRPIKDYCIGIYDGPHATPKESDDGPVFLGIKNITNDGQFNFSEIRHVSEQEFPKWTRRVTPQPGDVVFTYEATLHRYAIIPEGFRGCLGRRVALIRPDSAQVDGRYLLYFFLSQDWKATVESNVISGATVDRIPLEKFPNFPVSLPTLSIQKEIASILSTYDDLIENNRRRMALLEDAARQVYQEWFVRLRFPGREHTRIVDGVPEGWERKRLGEHLTLNYGKALKADIRVEGPYPVYGSSGIVGTHEKALVSGPAIILGRKGNVGSVFWSSNDFYPIDTVYFINAESSDLYLYYALKSMHFINTDVAVPGLNRDLAYSRELLLPSKGLLRSFLDTITSMHGQMEKLDEMNQKLRTARDLLLPKLMSGEIAV
ncbi:MAG TPA: restriction endonuclease subunit S [Desulfuromonadales bacterium]|nr:restriction endonuclease subunit S [Desulfuromonadales bacterium]